jgi:pilus assembly protein Flp/PilA
MTELYLRLTNWLKSEEEGQGLVEYALIIALIAVLLVGALTALKGDIQGAFENISNGLAGSGS